MAAKLTKIRICAALATNTIIFLLAVFAVASILYGWSLSDITASPLLGNRPEVISGLVDGQAEPQPFSFLVVGDPRSSAVFEEFYRNSSADIPPDFGVILGDFVAFPAVNRHRFFMGELAGWGMTFPIFLVAGNHDFARPNDLAGNEMHERNLHRLYDPFFIEDFERTYGPANFSFVYRGCLFIGLNDVYSTDYLDYLKDVLARRPSDVIITFVFMHIPPRYLSPLIQAREMDGEEKFMRLMDRYNVDYVFTGDFHSYFRADRKHTKYIISGGGGSDLRGGAGSFHHVLLMTVDPSKDRVDEVIYSIDPKSDPGHYIRTIMICGVYPIFEEYRLIWLVVFSLILAAVGVRIAVLLTQVVGKGRGTR
jgi:hypothetical protein